MDNGTYYAKNVQQPVPMYEHVYTALTHTGSYDPYVYERNIYRESVKFTNEPARFVAVSFDNGEVRTYVNGVKLRQFRIS